MSEESERKKSRELDAEVAEKVMGWRWFDCLGVAILCPPYMITSWLEHSVLQKPIDAPGERFREHIDGVKFFDSSYRANGGKTKPEFPHYSTDRGDALDAIEHHFGEWEIEAHANGKYTATGWVGDQKFEETRKTLPLAVCRMLLKAAAASKTSPSDSQS